jgi:hypothetical protein
MTSALRRTPRARVELTEFLLLNHLYQLERESEKVESTNKTADTPNAP